MRTTAIVTLCIPIALLMIAQPASAGAMIVEDPVGDAGSVGNGLVAQGYQDIVEEGLAKKGGAYVFSMKMAAPVPEDPISSNGIKAMFWAWGIDYDPNVYYGAWPLPPGWPTIVEFHISIMWDGNAFRAAVADHRPLLTGGDEVFWEVPFVIKGDELSVTVKAWMLGDVKEFFWGTSTSIWLAQLVGNRSYFVLDDIWFLSWPS